MATDGYKIVLYNDGEGLTHGDLNNNQRFLSAMLTDQMLGKLIGNPANTDPQFSSQTVNAPTTWAYALSVGGANPKQGSANNKLLIGAGTIFQKIANSDGNDMTLLPFTFDGTTEFTIANGDATNPRCDMIQMKLELENGDLQSRDFEDGTTHVITTTSVNKQRRVKATLSVKTGTPAASPVYPTPDAGYVPLCVVVVHATWAGATPFSYHDRGATAAVIHDLRMPINVKPFVNHARDFQVEGVRWEYAGITAPSNDYIQCISAAGGYIPAFVQTKGYGRLVGFALAHQGGHTAAATGTNLVRYGSSNDSNYFVCQLKSLLNTTATDKYRKFTFAQLNANLVFNADFGDGGAAPVVQGNGTHYPPIWSNGKRCPEEEFSTAADAPGFFNRLGLEVENSLVGYHISGCTWYFATGI